VAALIVAAAGFAVVHNYSPYPLAGHPPSTHRLAADDQFLALAAEFVGGGLFILMALAAFGSIRISRTERGDVEVNGIGVRRIFGQGHEEFFRREEIEGFVVRPGGGVTLVAIDSGREMVIPRSIEGYRDCIAELKAMGLRSLPATRLRANRKRTPAQWILDLTAVSLGSAFFSKGYGAQFHHAVGLGCLAMYIVYALWNDHKTDRFHWINWLGLAIFLAVVIYRW
jgi:hypothetical protein